MTTEAEVETDQEPDDATPETAVEPPRPGRSGRFGREAGFAAELAGLTGMAIARPIFDAFGGSPETFIARGSDALDVVAFGLIVALVPLALCLGVGALVRRVDPAVGVLVHYGTLGGLAAACVLQIGRSEVGWSLVLSAVLALVVGAVVVVLRWRSEGFQSFLRYAGLASVVFLVQFLALSPASSLIRGGRDGGPDEAATAAIEAAQGDDAPPVVVIVLDALPTATLLDGEGHIDEEVFPNLAALADDSTWYRDNTTVAPYTLKAVPAILSGRVLDGEKPPVAANYPQNLFTLLGGVYDVHAQEQITALCPEQLCPQATHSHLTSLLDDARKYWRKSISWNLSTELVPGAFDDRYERFEDWIDEQDFSVGDKPDLFAYHVLMPHGGWQYVPGGDEYGATWPPHGLVGVRWGPVGTEVGIQRHILQTQAVDELLGRLFDRLRAAGAYDDALIVVTADHGVAFEPGEPWRAVSEKQYEQIMWTPLLIKEPGQTEPIVDDTNVQSIDVLPAIADRLGVDLRDDLGWDVDGIAPGRGEPRDPADKPILDWKFHSLHADEGEAMVQVDGREGFERVLASDYVEGTGPDAVWRFTRYADLLGASVDEIEHGEPTGIEMESRDLDAFADVDLDDDRPRVELRALGWVEDGRAVAVALNGRIAAVVPARPTPYGVSLVHALVPLDSLAEGDNDLALYQVDGPPEAAVLRELALVSEG